MKKLIYSSLCALLIFALCSCSVFFPGTPKSVYGVAAKNVSSRVPSLSENFVITATDENDKTASMTLVSYEERVDGGIRLSSECSCSGSYILNYRMYFTDGWYYYDYTDLGYKTKEADTSGGTNELGTIPFVHGVFVSPEMTEVTEDGVEYFVITARLSAKDTETIVSEYASIMNDLLYGDLIVSFAGRTVFDTESSFTAKVSKAEHLITEFSFNISAAVTESGESVRVNYVITDKLSQFGEVGPITLPDFSDYTE